ncbi:hypothetical protein [Pelagicoccus mobilis]|uniref:GH16 domain-containing protein n=1 Tax=Pelagicoccus mobilis TaxID=415221 RepID=A0A934RSZ3_9BACT|nr:hypothetical protein [Pelagicoccus mobilis]MBK1875816.1 hypothetical protein [Pelagicoccus mobilis]
MKSIVLSRLAQTLCFAAFAACMSSAHAAPACCDSKEAALPTPPEGYAWEMNPYLSDEFNVDGLDTRKWMPKHPFWEGRDSYFTESNVSVSDGMLRLRSSLKNPRGKVKPKNITSAIMASNKPITEPGFYQARIKASDLSMTTAFWFQGDYSEIDVIENIGTPSLAESEWHEDTMAMNTHYYKEGWENDIDTPVKWTMPAKARDAFMVFGVWWLEDGTIRFYCNGEHVAEVKAGGDFDEPMYMYFDTEVFKWHGQPTKKSLLDESKNTFLVDWVRGWNLVAEDS